jgi:hypothetical protein
MRGADFAAPICPGLPRNFTAENAEERPMNPSAFWVPSWTFGSCNSFAAADFDADDDVDLDDLTTFEGYVEQEDMIADLDESQALDVLDLMVMLDAVGENKP